MKYWVLSTLRSLKLLGLADSIKQLLSRIRVYFPNRRFRARHRGLAMPPYSLAFDAYNMISWDTYMTVGRLHAEVFAELIRTAYPTGPVRVLEWGCGPGRLLRHLPELLGQDAELTGIDYNEETIAWCIQALPNIRFETNQLMPPTNLVSESVDAVINFSVFTHLSREAQIAWAAELKRLLRPGGLLICTTHGDNYLHLLARKEELDSYQSGELVVQGNYLEGRKWFLAIHPERFVRDKLLAGFTDVARAPVSPDRQLLQDVWIARKPLQAVETPQPAAI